MTDERGSNEAKSEPDRKDIETSKQELSDQELAAIAAGNAHRAAAAEKLAVPPGFGPTGRR